ncbi:hypothetical protein DCO58_00415 [Helicobacter saguini]|uniref:Poly A polymerase head domain-containing protein n=1 Tax=Helicobacter saguini TaxID=1548018 RepID=A0A347VQV3_9HELI|nr:hypothetical protein [Helicobacter saguini]MWV63144.1 hypothetical protein [Helicobacter saguini]MWV66186.1 hypothetical protein [Helicobacter saguini]MWV68535.1 hypothetical protein [Helicobacter saguini]MWV71910.1 hypothetical protein [Helicobacter saguini]TLD95924.1 hypothetical protein LS64_000740 [Helicobacter saguini]
MLKQTIKIPCSLKEIIKIIESNGFQGFIVGGCVRDILIGIQPKDWDIATNALPCQIKEIFKDNKQFNIFDIGEIYGTLGLFDRVYKVMFEITTYRIDDKYNDFRRPSNVKFTTSLKQDLNRRDFTINALAAKIC